MENMVYIGCRTTRERNARGKGLKVFGRMEDGSLTEMQLLSGIENPSYQCFDRTGQFLYTVHGDLDEVSAYRILDDGTLSYINTINGVGKNPVFITVDQTNSLLYTASLQGGAVSAIRRGEDGSIEPPFFKAVLPGKTEGAISHAHQCLWDRTKEYLFVPAQGRKIGYGEVNVFRKQEDGTLKKTDCLLVKEGDEPRHGAIHPNNRFYYFLNERGNYVTFCLFDFEKGTLSPQQNITSLPKDYQGEGQASALIIHPNGRYLYASNRIHDSITVYSIEENTGFLTMVENVPCLGKTPRFMTLNQDGTELIVANEDSDDIRFFRVDPETGGLQYTGYMLETESPVCVSFLDRMRRDVRG